MQRKLTWSCFRHLTKTGHTVLQPCVFALASIVLRPQPPCVRKCVHLLFYNNIVNFTLQQMTSLLLGFSLCLNSKQQRVNFFLIWTKGPHMEFYAQQRSLKDKVNVAVLSSGTLQTDTIFNQTAVFHNLIQSIFSYSFCTVFAADATFLFY